jgi:hypothetical protein
MYILTKNSQIAKNCLLIGKFSALSSEGLIFQRCVVDDEEIAIRESEKLPTHFTLSHPLEELKPLSFLPSSSLHSSVRSFISLFYFKLQKYCPISFSFLSLSLSLSLKKLLGSLIQNLRNHIVQEKILETTEC